MEENDQIPVVEFCIYHEADETIIKSLHQSGLIELNFNEGKPFIPVSEISNLEKLLRLYYDLDINLEGIETIYHLQSRIEELNHELNKIRNKLMFYEDPD